MKLGNKLIIGILLVIVNACSDRTDVVLDNPTELEVQVLGPTGQPVSNAEVRIFRNLRDWESLTREVDIQTTDQSGVARFTNLQSANYYFYTSFESNGNLVSNQYLDLDLGVYGSNFNLADVVVENGITRVSVSAIYERPLQFSNFEIIEVQLFLISQGQFIEVSTDTAEMALLTLVDYDFEDDINNQFGQVINDYGNELFSDKKTIDVGEQYIYTPDFVNGYNLQDLINDPEQYQLLFFEINQNDFSLYNDVFGSVTINEVAFSVENSGKYSYRFKDAGSFSFSNDNYVIDLILDWY